MMGFSFSRAARAGAAHDRRTFGMKGEIVVQ
jgi:hypothetical protein